MYPAEFVVAVPEFVPVTVKSTDCPRVIVDADDWSAFSVATGDPLARAFAKVTLVKVEPPRIAK